MSIVRKLLCICFCCVLLYVAELSPAFAVSTKPSDVVALSEQLTALQKYVHDISVVWNPATQKPVADALVRTTIASGVLWLIHAQEDSGHFSYEYLPYEDRYREDDNIVRQAGALYALGEVARKSEVENAQTNQAIEKAIGYFEKLSVEHVYEGDTLRCVAKSEKSTVCKLGATSLTLVGILGYVEANPKKEKEYRSLIEGYVTFILKSKKPDTGFRDQYQIGKGFRGDTESSFSNGEALLALVRYYQYKKSTDVKSVIDESYRYLQLQPFDANLYLWMMAALKDMHTLFPSELYLTYGKAFTLWRLQLIQASHTSVHNYCPANEGFASAYSLLKKKMSPVELQQLRTEIDFWNTKNRGLQIGTSEKMRVALEEGKVVFKEMSNTTQSAGGFLTGIYEPAQRIDFTQHCLNTYLQTLVDIDEQTL